MPRERCKAKDDILVIPEVDLATQDPDIMHDLRILNGRPKNKLFDIFCSEIESLLESHARVDDRLHGEKVVNITHVDMKCMMKYVLFCRRYLLSTGGNVC
jgi:hypothetical protein